MNANNSHLDSTCTKEALITSTFLVKTLPHTFSSFHNVTFWWWEDVRLEWIRVWSLLVLFILLGFSDQLGPLAGLIYLYLQSTW